MVHLITNPTKGPNGVYYYVKRVPKDLIAKIGKERYSISLAGRTRAGPKPFTAAKSVRLFPCCGAARINLKP
jgi:hypothetical protein